jgi:hypothetical protein
LDYKFQVEKSVNKKRLVFWAPTSPLAVEWGGQGLDYKFQVEKSVNKKLKKGWSSGH